MTFIEHRHHKDRQLFRKVIELTKEFHHPLKVIKSKHGDVLTENHDILGRWREYSSEMYHAPHDTDDASENNDEMSEREPDRGVHNQTSNGKSPGCDDVPIELIKEGKKKKALSSITPSF